MTEPARSIPSREHRPRVLKGAAILGDVNTSEIKCLVRNMHDNGAELKAPLGVQIPNEFLLYVAVDGTAYKCTVRWRDGQRIGVRFVGTEPKPGWHYG